jgi:hypothetical protein
MPAFYPVVDAMTREQAESIGGTGIWKVPDKGKFTGIFLDITCSGAAARNALEKSKIIDTISKIEVIVNGADELHSYTGQLAQAMAFFDRGINPVDKITEYATAMQRCIIPLSFGCKWFDNELGLTAENYESVRLHVTNDMSSTYWSGLAITPYYIKMAGDVAGLFAKGVLEKKIYKEYVTVQDGTEEIDLEETGLLRRILLQAIPNRSSNKDACDFRDLFYDLKYTGKSGDILFFDQNLNALLWWNAFDYGFDVISHGQAYRAADDAFQHGAGMLLAAALGSSSADDAVSAVVPTKSGDDDGSIKFEGYEADSPIDFLTKGVGMFHTGVLRHDREPDMSDLLDMAAWKTLHLKLHTRNSSSAASGDVKILTERVVPK